MSDSDCPGFTRSTTNTLHLSSGTPARLFPEPKRYALDWTRVQSLPELLEALNAIGFTVGDNCSAYARLKHLTDEEKPL